MRLRPAKPTAAAGELFRCACGEAAEISFAVGAEHLVLACALYGAGGLDPDDVRQRIVADERDALASIGISLDSVRGELEDRLHADGCLPVSPEAKRMLALASRRRRSVTADQLLATLEEHSPTARRLLRDVRR